MLFHLPQWNPVTTKRAIVLSVAAAIIGGAAIAADQSKEQLPYNYGASQQNMQAPAPAQQSTPAPAPTQEQKPRQPDGRQFNYKPMPPEEGGGSIVKPKKKPEKKRQLAHKPSRRPFNYDTRFIDREKIRRCMKELPFKGLLKEHNTPEGRKEFCETYQIELWAAQDQKKVKERLKDIFESKPKPRPKPQQDIPTMGYQ